MKKLLGFLVVFVVLVNSFCSISFAEEQQYTDNLIPQMTSDTTPTGEAFAITHFKDSFDQAYPWKAFDRDPSHTQFGKYHTWCLATPAGYLGYKFPSPQIITKYTIQTNAYNGIASFPRTWTFEGSMDGTTWSVLDTRTNISDWVNNKKKEFVFTNNTSYLMYRINITANVSSSQWSVKLMIGELEMMGPATSTPANPTTPAPPSVVDGNRAILIVTMQNGNKKEYDMTNIQIDEFINWYEDRNAGISGTKGYYVIKKNYNIKPFLNRWDYLVYNKITDFEVKDYTD